ncbi:STAS domain-containing protein [Shouchella miscanthi]|uniref:STAS domain-containing protein n=1 Tax=Shouchella miscanthi TaxID=2598861 RepID=A0ABU6NEB6_9BACI|nr:STAS domain-containing protein [Shouchella miscanthi]
MDKDKNGICSSRSDVKASILKSQNQQFHEIFIEIFNLEGEYTEESFHYWIDNITSDQPHLETPLYEIIEEFLSNQQIYLNHIKKYFEQHGQELSYKEYSSYVEIVTDTFTSIIVKFSKKNHMKSKQLIQAQSELITELSSPIITLNDNISLLPLVGEIDTHRAQVVFTNTIEICSSQNVECLLIDLSGVPILDTMVANELFQLIKGLRLIGTRTSLCGVKPGIAQTAVHLGIDFEGYKVYSSIAKALAKLDFTTIDI